MYYSVYVELSTYSGVSTNHKDGWKFQVVGSLQVVGSSHTDIHFCLLIFDTRVESNGLIGECCTCSHASCDMGQ
jgi:hypothetical protein